MSGPPVPLKKQTVVLLLLFIVITGTLFRLAGLSSGYQRVDDVPVARQIERNYLGDWRPDFIYYYPNCFDYIAAVALRGVSAAFRVVGVQRESGLYPFSLEQILFAARLLSALLGSATILLVYAIGRRLYAAREGLIAAFLFSVSHIHILFSHQLALDIPMSFFYALSLYGCVLIAQERRWGDYALAGLFGGLAVATKYNGIFVFAAIFLAHLLTNPAPRKKVLGALLDGKIYLAGAAGAAGFFLGHPYALLKFKTFLGASKVLLGTVHETEWFLRPIQPKTGIELVAYSKYSLALKNILSAEGAVFLALILLGVVAVSLRRNRKTSWLALSGLTYFLAAMGYLGFSRYRDLVTFTIFGAFLGMAGLKLIWDSGSRSKALRLASGILVVAAVLALEFGGWVKSYYLWEDDTTEMAERWFRRNVPEASYVGKEWFSPPLRGGDYRFPTFSRAYLFSRDFAPYSRFDYIITSSAAYGHFFQNKKFYPDHIRFYRSIREQNELIKDFYFRDIEYKNPELQIYSTKHPGRKKQQLELPPAIPWDNPTREFESADGSPYGKSVMEFYLEEGRSTERTILSRRKIPSLAVFVSGAAGRGKLEVRNSGQTQTLEVEPGSTAVLIIKPWLSFPFYHYIYRLSVEARGSVGSALVRLGYDEFDIGSELFRLGDWRRARAHLIEALKNKSVSGRDTEISVDLAVCCRNLGLTEEADRYAAQARSGPLFKRYLGLFRPPKSEAAWRRDFEKFSGLDLELFEALQANRIAAAEFDRPAPPAESAPGGGQSEEVRLVSDEKRLLPQRYRAELRFTGPSGIPGPPPRLELQAIDQEAGIRQALPIEPRDAHGDTCGASVFGVEGRQVGGRVRFIVILDKAQQPRFESLTIYPDIFEFMSQKSARVRALPGPQVLGH